jgi:hypothetical protein
MRLEKVERRRDHHREIGEEDALSESDPIRFRPRDAGGHSRTQTSLSSVIGYPSHISSPVVAFNRAELEAILDVYARKVAAGEWRDYALEMGREKAVFAIFQRASEYPLFRVEKCPKLARRQGAYSVVLRSGAVLKRGHDLARVLAACASVKLAGR